MPSQVSERNSPKVVRIYHTIHVAPWKLRKFISVYPEIGLDPNGLGRGKGGDIDGQNAFIGVEKLAPGSEEISRRSCGPLGNQGRSHMFTLK